MKSGLVIQFFGQVAKVKGRPGVGFAVRTSLVSQLESQPKGINDRIMTMRLPLQDNTNATLISAYAPTMTNPDDTKEVFYQQLDEVVRSVPTADRWIILGDLNARIGSNHTVGRESLVIMALDKRTLTEDSCRLSALSIVSRSQTPSSNLKMHTRPRGCTRDLNIGIS